MSTATSRRSRSGRTGWSVRRDGSPRRPRRCGSLPTAWPRATRSLEATGNTHAIVRLLAGRVARVVVSNPQKTRAIAEAKVKTDKVDAEILAQLLAADDLPGVWVADEATQARRRQVARRAHLVRQRTRLKNQVQSILHRNLVPRCPAAD